MLVRLLTHRINAQTPLTHKCLLGLGLSLLTHPPRSCVLGMKRGACAKQHLMAAGKPLD